MPARKAIPYVLDKLNWMRAECIWPNGLRYTWTDAFGVILLVSLYAELGKPRFLDEAEWVVSEVERVSVPKTPSVGFAIAGESEHDCWMFAIAFLFVRVLCDCFKSRRRLEAEILVLRHQLNVLQLRTPRRLYLTWIDRALFV